MQKLDTFSSIKSCVLADHTLVIDQPFLIGIEFDITEDNRKQSIYLTEIEARNGDRFLRIETTIAPLEDFDAEKCLRLNLVLRVGYLAVGDLDGTPYIKMCENIGYDSLAKENLFSSIERVAKQADEIEAALSDGADIS